MTMRTAPRHRARVPSALRCAAAAVAAPASGVVALLRGGADDDLAEVDPALGGDGPRAEQGLQVAHQAGRGRDAVAGAELEQVRAVAVDQP
ncbi:MAG: hypothetical protein QOG98_2103 [Pseudonocardiales bacterium]|nr:hypothetical protein [Pseudonocardiales bacterium]